MVARFLVVLTLGSLLFFPAAAASCTSQLGVTSSVSPVSRSKTVGEADVANLTIESNSLFNDLIINDISLSIVSNVGTVVSVLYEHREPDGDQSFYMSSVQEWHHDVRYDVPDVPEGTYALVMKFECYDRDAVFKPNPMEAKATLFVVGKPAQAPGIPGFSLIGALGALVLLGLAMRRLRN